jgi:PIN domain nuclease of toxin-antitoxin system
MAATVREILLKAESDRLQKQRELATFISRRNSTGAALALDIKRSFTFPADGAPKRDEHDP